MTGLPDTWIRFSADELRGHWRRMGWWTASCAVLAVVGFFVPDGRGPDKAPDGWLAVAVVGALWLFVVLIGTESAYGSALLTSEGIRFHTWVSRRFVPWQDVTDVDKYLIAPGYWYGLRLRRSHGRRPAVPGAFARRYRDKSFDEKFRTIQYYRSRAARPKR